MQHYRCGLVSCFHLDKAVEAQSLAERDPWSFLALDACHGRSAEWEASLKKQLRLQQLPLSVHCFRDFCLHRS